MADYAELALVKLLEEDASWGSVLGEGYVKMMNRFWTEDYVRLVVDRWPASLTFGDVFSFLRVHELLGSGKAVMTEIHLGETPLADKHVKAMDAVLRQLPAPFSATFWGGTETADGYVEWSEPIQANSIRDDGVEVRATIAPARAPLEVGHTKGSTTLLHILEKHRLARWPYHSDKITLIHLIEPVTI